MATKFMVQKDVQPCAVAGCLMHAYLPLPLTHAGQKDVHACLPMYAIPALGQRQLAGISKESACGVLV